MSVFKSLHINSMLFYISVRFTPSELSRVGDAIGQVSAVDIDKDTQSNVFYGITGGNEQGMKQIWLEIHKSLQLCTSSHLLEDL